MVLDKKLKTEILDLLIDICDDERFKVSYHALLPEENNNDRIQIRFSAINGDELTFISMSEIGDFLISNIRKFNDLIQSELNYFNISYNIAYIKVDNEGANYLRKKFGDNFSDLYSYENSVGRIDKKKELDIKSLLKVIAENMSYQFINFDIKLLKIK